MVCLRLIYYTWPGKLVYIIYVGVGLMGLALVLTHRHLTSY